MIFLIGKGSDKEDLAQLRKDICARYITKPYRTWKPRTPSAIARPPPMRPP